MLELFSRFRHFRRISWTLSGALRRTWREFREGFQ